MDITFDPAKRMATLENRGLDFADAALVFEGRTATNPAGGQYYGEPRFITAGLLSGRVVVLVWTPRENSRRIISMRYAHEREARHFNLD